VAGHVAGSFNPSFSVTNRILLIYFFSKVNQHHFSYRKPEEKKKKKNVKNLFLKLLPLICSNRDYCYFKILL